MSKIFVRWGLEKQLREIAYLQQYVCFMRCTPNPAISGPPASLIGRAVEFVGETGEIAAQGEWVPDFRLESGGVFFGMHVRCPSGMADRLEY